MSPINTIHIAIKAYLIRCSLVSIITEEFENTVIIHQISDTHQLTEHLENNKGIFIVDSEILNFLPAGYKLPHFVDIVCITLQTENVRFKGWVKEWININDTKHEIISKISILTNPCQPEILVDETLSDREKEVIQLVAKGLTNKEIADKLNLSIHTIITHRKNITGKLGIKTISGLSIYAYLNGLIQSEETIV